MGSQLLLRSRLNHIIMKFLVVLSVLGCAFAVPLVQEATPEVVANTVEAAPSEIAPAETAPMVQAWLGPHASLFAAGDARFVGLSDTVENMHARNQFELVFDEAVKAALPAWRAQPFLVQRCAHSRTSAQMGGTPRCPPRTRWSSHGHCRGCCRNCCLQCCLRCCRCSGPSSCPRHPCRRTNSRLGNCDQEFQ